MNILGIETSCDETAAAVVQNGQKVLSNIIVTSLKEHEKYGGIIPEIASRRQLECINAIVREALDHSKLRLKDIDAVAVTSSPGLIGSLLVGISFARALSFTIRKPLIQVDHIRAHVYANFLVDATSPLLCGEEVDNLPKLPVIGLVVSGGHTSLYHIKNFHRFQLIGQTLDDAAGEAFDKVARILKLEYPGGPAIDRLAKTVKQTNLRFKPAELPGTFDFSFSGVKTAVLYHHLQARKDKNLPVAEVAYAFQKSVVDILIKKSLAACHKYKAKTLVVGGGVAANTCLRKELIQKGRKEGIRVFFPPFSFCLDNAAMIAGMGYQSNHLRKKSILN